MADLLDIAHVKPIIEAELLASTEKRKRSELERAYEQRRKDVATLYQKLSIAEAVQVLPPLPVFRNLPMVQRIQFKPTNAPSVAVAKELKQSTLIVSLVDEEVARWRTDARAALAAVLGVNSWRSASTKKLHPVDRLTARFRCKECDSRGCSRGWDVVSFDFAGACRHQCKNKNGKWLKKPWKAENFVPDLKVSFMEVPRIIMFLTSSSPKIGHRYRPASPCTA